MREFMKIVENVSEIVWHGSPDNFDITQAKPLTHFGSKQAATHRIHTKRAEFSGGQPRALTIGYLYPVHLAISNPVKIRDRAGLTHDSYKLTDMLHYTIKKITREEREEIMATNCDMNKIVEVLSRKGYDGMAYTNAVEDPGHTSYMTFHAGQITAAGPTERYIHHGALKHA